MKKEGVIKVLLVDDEETLVEYLAKRLRKEGFMVTAVLSGEKAVEEAQQAHFDVAVIDLKMPGMDGVETQKRLKEIQSTLQSIVLTGHGSIESALESGHQDAFQYLLKPAEFEDLVKVIREAYRRKIEVQETIFRERVNELYRSGLGAKGLKKAMDDLRKAYGIED
jgi:DNA-binding NtrC family response regulator